MGQAFANAYKDIPWQTIYSSPMKRTQATIAPMVKVTGLYLQLRDGLKEINDGDWEGRTQVNVKIALCEDYNHWMTEPSWNPPTGGETAVQIANRAMAVIAEIEEKYTDSNVLVDAWAIAATCPRHYGSAKAPNQKSSSLAGILEAIVIAEG